MEEVIRKKVKYEESEHFLGIELQPQEMHKLYIVVNTIIDYREDSTYDLEHQIKSIEHVPQEVLELLPELRSRPQRIKACLNENYFFLKQIIGFTELKRPVPNHSYYPFNIGQIEYLLAEVAREWSAECAAQRNYIQTIKELIVKHIPNCQNILVPGFSTGRILAELLLEGYNVQGNQQNFAHFLVANFILNSCSSRMNIYPYVHNFCNFMDDECPYQKLQIPDLIPTNSIENQGLCASVGNFFSIYSDHKDQWDCIVTCFYIERVKSVIRLIKLIKQCLKTNGVWINYGSLHYEQAEVELNAEELTMAITNQGFSILEQGISKNKHHYNKNRMLNNEIDCIYFTARKQPVT